MWMEDGHMLWYTKVSHPQILPPIPGSPPRPTNEEQIIAHQWEQHQARGSTDTYDIVSGIVSYADEHLGQKIMSPKQLYAALRHVREQIAPVLTRRRAWRSRRQQQEHEQDQEYCYVVSLRICSF